VTASDGVAEIDPVTRNVSTIRVAAGGTDAATVPGGVAMAGTGGLKAVDTKTWKTRWHDRSARSVQASGTRVVSSGGGTVKARDARSGRLLWRASGSAQAVAAGRVYTQSAVLDLATGELVGTLPPIYSAIRFAIPPVG
jgi:outer membrane protein assembly factor BamB